MKILQPKLHLSRLFPITGGCLHYNKTKLLPSFAKGCSFWSGHKFCYCCASTSSKPNQLVWSVRDVWPRCLSLGVPLQALSCCTSQKWSGCTFLCWRRARTITPWRQLQGLCRTSALGIGLWVLGWESHKQQHNILFNFLPNYLLSYILCLMAFHWFVFYNSEQHSGSKGNTIKF